MNAGDGEKRKGDGMKGQQAVIFILRATDEQQLDAPS
jgi:hypothetical protein